MADEIIRIKQRGLSEYLCEKGLGASNGSEVRSNTWPRILELIPSKSLVGFCQFLLADSLQCSNPRGKKSDKPKGQCPFPGRGYPMYPTQNAASEALLKKYKEIQALVDINNPTAPKT